MNLALYGLGEGGKRTWMAVDLGVSFAGDELPGVDLIMPDIALPDRAAAQSRRPRAHPRA